MRTRPKATALAVAIAATLTLAGCTQPAPRAIPTAKPTTALVFASRTDAVAAALKAYMAYVAMSDRVLGDGGRNPGRMLSVATPEQYRQDATDIAAVSRNHWHSTGNTSIDSVLLQDYEPTAPGGRAIVTIYACVDVRALDVVDAQGNSVVSPNRSPTSTYLTVFDVASRDPARLVVADQALWQGDTICNR
jgi:hypothetical protein